MALVAFHEPFGSGHGPNALAGLVSASIRRGWDALVFSPKAPELMAYTPKPDESHRPGRVDWVESTSNGKPYGLARGRDLNELLRQANRHGAQLFVELTFDYEINSAGFRPDTAVPLVVVLHSAHHLVPASLKMRSRVRSAVARRNLHQVKSRGAIVVHTKRARELVANGVGAAHVHQLDWAVTSRAEAPPTSTPTDRRILFCGAVREEKGFLTLMEALRTPHSVETIEFNGVPTSEQVRLARDRVPNVEAAPSWVGPTAYHEAFQRAAVAVLPYQPTAQSNVSSTLLDVLLHGVPSVISDVIATQLPRAYGGAIVVPGNDPEALIGAIERAFAEHDALTEAARRQGPNHVIINHSFETYLDRLVQAAGMASL